MTVLGHRLTPRLRGILLFIDKLACVITSGNVTSAPLFHGDQPIYEAEPTYLPNIIELLKELSRDYCNNNKAS